MSFKDLFQIFSKDDYEEELKEKISTIEKNIEELKQSINLIYQKEKQQSPEQKEPPIIIEKINIEKVILDKYELNNNFGQLGIKELKGKLNIGATYGSDFIPRIDEEDKEKTEKCNTNKVRRHNTKTGPKINIHSKSEN